jgi:hypothetical protein
MRLVVILTFLVHGHAVAFATPCPGWACVRFIEHRVHTSRALVRLQVAPELPAGGFMKEGTTGAVLRPLKDEWFM